MIVMVVMDVMTGMDEFMDKEFLLFDFFWFNKVIRNSAK